MEPIRIIPLTQGLFAIVDDVDYAKVSQHSWYAVSKGRRWYAARAIVKDGKVTSQRMHGFILGTNKTIDHANGFGLDNRRENLRPATTSQNMANRGKQAGKYSSAYKGVTWHKARKRWQAQLECLGKPIYVGVYKSEIDAAKAYNAAAKTYFGEFASLNPV